MQRGGGGVRYARSYVIRVPLFLDIGFYGFLCWSLCACSQTVNISGDVVGRTKGSRRSDYPVGGS